MEKNISFLNGQEINHKIKVRSKKKGISKWTCTKILKIGTACRHIHANEHTETDIPWVTSPFKDSSTKMESLPLKVLDFGLQTEDYRN